MAAKQKTVYCCSECGNETPNWAGKCPACGAWNTLVELKLDSDGTKGRGARGARAAVPSAKKISELDTSAEIRFSTGISEFDRVLGGGAVVGALVLVGGAPGIGKSTLLLQMCGMIDKGRRVLYITGEESERQLKLRATRLGIDGDIYVLAETDIDSIIACIGEVAPDVVIIDSIQTVSDAEVSSAPGSITQVRECTMRLMRVTKDKGLTMFVVGHINKEGSIAGPKVLEHMVDCVLYFEGERSTSFRILRAAKNRFGSTNEIGVFEMADNGLRCVENPSEMLLSGRPENSPGTCVACVIEGTRPILAEVQALLCQAGYNSAARRSNGIDYNRTAMLLAVLEKRGGLPVSNCDSYINVIGGLFLDEPAADLATILAIASSYLDRPLGADLAAIGEVGLSGEVRSVSALNQRLTEISRLGFKRCVIPAHVRDEVKQFDGMDVIPVKNVREAIRAVLGKNG